MSLDPSRFHELFAEAVERSRTNPLIRLVLSCPVHGKQMELVAKDRMACTEKGCPNQVEITTEVVLEEET